MKKVCLLIGEGDSERYFFPKILERKSFSATSAKEGTMSIFYKDDIYWFFPFPPHLGSQLAGKSKLKKSTTYKLASSYVKTNAHLFCAEMYEIHLVVIFDTDGGAVDETIREIEQAISDSGMLFTSSSVLPVDSQIESWYFAGLDDTFPYFKNINGELKRLLSCKTCNSHNKANFLTYTSDQMIGAKDIAQSVAEHFAEEEAIKYSESFKAFHNCIKEKGLY